MYLNVEKLTSSLYPKSRVVCNSIEMYVIVNKKKQVICKTNDKPLFRHTL